MTLEITRGVTMRAPAPRRTPIREFVDALKALQPGESRTLERLTSKQRGIITAVNHLLGVRITTATLAGGRVRVGRVA